MSVSIGKIRGMINDWRDKVQERISKCIQSLRLYENEGRRYKEKRKKKKKKSFAMGAVLQYSGFVDGLLGVGFGSPEPKLWIVRPVI